MCREVSKMGQIRFSIVGDDTRFDSIAAKVLLDIKDETNTKK